MYTNDKQCNSGEKEREGGVSARVCKGEGWVGHNI